MTTSFLTWITESVELPLAEMEQVWGTDLMEVDWDFEMSVMQAVMSRQLDMGQFQGWGGQDWRFTGILISMPPPDLPS